MKLYHYYEKNIGPFRSISELSDEEAEGVLERIREEKPDIFLAKRPEDYLAKRRRFEGILREEFLKKGGVIQRATPHYMVVEACPFFEKWYEQAAYVEVDAQQLDLRTVSFTYGDSHPTFSGNVKDGKEYRNRLYTYEEILGIIEKYGLPQVWNPDFRYGPECYIEVQIWSDTGLGVLERAKEIIPNCRTYLIRGRGHMHFLTEKEKRMIVRFLLGNSYSRQS